MFAMLVPWRTSLSLPAVIEEGVVLDIFASEDSKIRKVNVSHNQYVAEGDLLVVMTSPLISNKVEKAIDRVKMIQQKLDRRVGSKLDLSNLLILENELQKEIEILNSLKEENKALSIYAPSDGIIKDLISLNTNQWVNKKDKLFSIVQSEEVQVIAFVSETDLDKIKKVSSGYFPCKK